MNFIEEIRIRLKPRYKKIQTRVLGFPITAVDKSSFLFMYKEIFENQIYKFISKKTIPKIIDCGANIGLSVIYFKKLYPNSEVIAFEPDPNIFSVLQANIKSANIDKVKIVNCGLSDTSEDVNFLPDNSDGGRLSPGSEDENAILIKTRRLSEYLNEHVDFLKIDIEGEEAKVIEESQNALKNVDNIFIEYHSFIDRQQELHKILSILNKNGFRYFLSSIGVSNKQAFMSANSYSGMDMQINIYAKRK